MISGSVRYPVNLLSGTSLNFIKVIWTDNLKIITIKNKTTISKLVYNFMCWQSFNDFTNKWFSKHFLNPPPHLKILSEFVLDRTLVTYFNSWSLHTRVYSCFQSSINRPLFIELKLIRIDSDSSKIRIKLGSLWSLI